jgi:small subunit ribosomal protein S21
LSRFLIDVSWHSGCGCRGNLGIRERPRKNGDRYDVGGEEVIRSVRIELRDSESFESLLRRFTKEMQKSGKLREFRSKRRFVSKSEQRRAKLRKAEHKRRRKAAQQGQAA